MKIHLIFFLFFCLLADVSMANMVQVADTTTAKAIYREATDLIYQGKYQEAIDQYLKSAVLFQSAGRQEDYLKAYLQHTWNRFRLGDYEALKVELEALVDTLEAPSAENQQETIQLQLAEAYYQLVAINNRMGTFKYALDYGQQCIDIRKRYLPDDDPELGKVYNAVGITNFHRRDFEAATDFYEQSMAIRIKQSGPNHPRMATTLNNIGNCYSEQGDYVTAKRMFEQALRIKEANLPPDHYSIPPTLTNLGMTYFHTEVWDSSIYFLNRAIELESKIFGKNHPQIGDKYGNISSVYAAKGDYEKALELSQKAVRLFQTGLGNHNNRTARAQNAIGNHYMDLGQPEQALIEAQKAVWMMYPEIDTMDYFAVPELNDESQYRDDLQVLTNKGILHIRRFKGNQDLKELKTAELCFDRAIEGLEIARRELGSESAQFELMFDYGYYFEQAIDVALQLHEQTQEEAYRIKAINLLESSKSIVLKGSIQAKDAIQYAGIPQQINEQEAAFQQHISDLQAEIGFTEDPHLRDSLLEALSAERIAHREFIKQLETDYPQYYATKFDVKFQDLKAIQEFLGQQNKQLLSYFIGEDIQFVSLIQKDQFQIKRLDLSSENIQQIEALYDLLSNRNKALNQARSKALFQDIIGQGHALHQLLIPFDLAADQGLVIVPDGRLNYLPFDLLVQKPVDLNAVDYSQVPFLIRDWSIQYTYSATLWMRPDLRTNQKPDFFAGFSGYYPVSGTLEFGSRHSTFEPLQFADQEVQSIAEMVGGKAYVNMDSIERFFKQAASDYQVLHLAMHAYTDDEHPLRSGLIFSQDKANAQPDILFAHELYGMQIDAQLVVLSACNTGFGKITNGDGLLSMGRAFRHAGCSNILMSLWQSDDQTTQALMAAFYEALKDGHSKEDALQIAKLSLLDQTNTQFPHFWSSFSVWGNAESIHWPKH
ncbi:MAG: CHAT domain-containing tetratricopeptide repeat protein, partial [Bacteroidota bacterium]